MADARPYEPYQALTMALALEREGLQFYRHMAGRAVSIEVRELFEELAESEVEHVRTIEEEILPGFTRSAGAESPREVEPRHIYPTRDISDQWSPGNKDLVRVIDFAIRAAELTLQHYRRLREATEDPRGQAAFDRILEKEREQLTSLKEMWRKY